MVFAFDTKILRCFGSELVIHTDCTHNWCSLANNTGGDRPWLMGTLIYEGVNLGILGIFVGTSP